MMSNQFIFAVIHQVNSKTIVRKNLSNQLKYSLDLLNLTFNEYMRSRIHMTEKCSSDFYGTE